MSHPSINVAELEADVLLGCAISAAPAAVAGTRFTLREAYAALAITKYRWHSILKRWNQDESLEGIHGAHTILGWVQQPDRPEYGALNRMPYRDFAEAVRKDKAGMYILY